MISIEITDDVRITSDGTCTTIERRLMVADGKNAGQSRWVSVGHYPSVETAAHALASRYVLLVAKTDAVMTLAAFGRTVSDGHDKIAAALARRAA